MSKLESDIEWRLHIFLDKLILSLFTAAHTSTRQMASFLWDADQPKMAVILMNCRVDCRCTSNELFPGSEFTILSSSSGSRPSNWDQASGDQRSGVDGLGLLPGRNIAS